MHIITTTVGSYPRPEWFREYLKRMEGLQKELDVEVDRDVLRKAVREVIDRQKKAGIELVTDGQLIWHDFLATIASRIDGFYVDGLVRYFDNNLYYRIPVIKERIRRRGQILYDFKIAYEIESNIKAVLSLFTVLKLSRNIYYKSFEDSLWDLCDVLKSEIAELIDLGVKYIQFDEPSLLYADEKELKILEDVYKELTNFEAETILMTYFRSAKSIFPYVLDFGFDVIGLDFVEGFDENLDVLREYGLENVNVGIVDGRNTKMEGIDELKMRFEKIADATELKKVYISPNTGLEFLPDVKAYEKMKLVSRFKKVIT